MAVSPLRRWLRRLPHPTKLRVDGRDVAIATGPNHWALTEESIHAMNPSRVEALADNGVVLRVTALDRDEDDEPAAAEETDAKSELVQLARIIGEAHDAGARRHAEAYALAFAENTKLVQILAARLGGLETAWQRAMQQTAQAQANAVMAAAQSSDDDPAGGAIATMLASAMMQQQPKPAAPPKTNGTAKKGA